MYEQMTARIVPFGMLLCGSLKSPDMEMPDMIPVTAGKKIAKTDQKCCPFA